MSNDITYCENKKCRYRKCYRHWNNRLKGMPYYSVAELEGTEYCEKREQ